MEKETVIILKISSYSGTNTYLEVGGEHLKEEETMYAMLHFKANETEGAADYGYKSVAEAMEVAKTIHPNAEILRAE